MTTKLRLYARGDACVPDPHGSDATPQRRRIVGRMHKEVSPGNWGWVPTQQVESLDYHHDLAKAAKDGELWPADAETAKALGVKFDPQFGGEDVDGKGSPPDKTTKAGAAGSKGNS